MYRSFYSMSMQVTVLLVDLHTGKCTHHTFIGQVNSYFTCSLEQGVVKYRGFLNLQIGYLDAEINGLHCLLAIQKVHR